MPAGAIDIDLDSSDPAVTRLERHSYVNLINVIHAELQLVERMLDAPGSLRSAIHLAEAASRAFKEARVARRHLDELSRFAELVESDLEEALREAGDQANAADVREACTILRDVLPDAHLRVQEVIARHRIARPVAELDADELFTAPVGASGGSVAVAPVHVLRSLGPVQAPLGLRHAVGSLVVANTPDAGVDRVELEAGEQLRLTVSGRASGEYLAPLCEHRRPSEIHELLEDRGEPLRGLVLLTYLAMPDGSVRLEVEHQRFVFHAALPRPEIQSAGD